MNNLTAKIREAFEKLSPEPPPREVYRDYRHLLQARKNKVLRIAKFAAEDEDVYVAIRAKQILRKIDSFDYKIITKNQQPIHEHSRTAPLVPN